MPNLKSTKSISKALKTLVQEGIPYISGTLSLPKTEAKLFYHSTGGSNGLVDFSTNSDESLEALANACTATSLGVAGQGKAGKMDVEEFSTQFAPLNHGVGHLIHQNLFKGKSKGDFQIKLYKLHVYGPGSFSEAHVDAPRGDNMFGSLVVVLPTKHEGGALVLRHGRREWTFDSANAVDCSDPTSLRAAFTVFYSSVDHDVAPIESGYRVTLTYSLYFTGSTLGKSHILQNSTTLAIQQYLKALLDRKNFLPGGGHLGFKLEHRYPVNIDTKLANADLKASLHGLDGCLFHALVGLGINTTVQIFYEMGSDMSGDDTYYMFDKPLEGCFDEGHDGYRATNFAEDHNGTLVQHLTLEDCYNAATPGSADSEDDGYPIRMGEEWTPTMTPIYWINSNAESATTVSTPFVAEGRDDPFLGYFRGEISIVAKVGFKGSRQVVAQ